MEVNHYEMERSWVKTDDLQWRLQLNSTTFYLEMNTFNKVFILSKMK